MKEFRNRDENYFYTKFFRLNVQPLFDHLVRNIFLTTRKKDELLFFNRKDFHFYEKTRNARFLSSVEIEICINKYLKINLFYKCYPKKNSKFKNVGCSVALV